MQTVYRTCTLCEACCGLAFQVEGEKILSVAPDEEDVFSRGHACAKGLAIAAVHDDPDRLRRPVRRTPGGDFEPISWDEALAETCRRLADVRREHGADAVAVYMGNPIIHNHGALLLRAALMAALGTRNSYSATSQDTSPRFATSFLLYGSSFATPVPDVDRTDHFLCLGANPVVSNGSALTAPKLRERLRAIRARGGRVVMVDPRRSESARQADEHVPILPGGDAALQLAMLQVLDAEGRIALGPLAPRVRGFERVLERVRRLDPARLSAECGIAGETIARLARELADARRGVVYSRVGVCNSRVGTLATWATDLLNIALGRLGAVGGALFASPAFDLTRVTRLPGMDGFDRWRSRVRGLPETIGDLPAAGLADEIETPGEGQVHALLTFAGNPVLSVPNGGRLARALEGLDFMVSIDLYVNETTRHADLILPPCWSLADDHVDVLLSAFAAHNVARWSPPVVPKRPGERADWEILLAIAEGLGGGPTGRAPVDAVLRLAGRLGLRFHPTRVLDLLLRTGRHGDRFLPLGRGLRLAKLRRAPHGVDLGPLEPGVARRIFHRDGKIHADAQPLLDGLDAWAASPPPTRTGDELLLVGRRDPRTNNSWMHNVPAMVSGRERCVLLVHPDDAERLGLRDGERAWLESRVHGGLVPVEVSDEMRPGVVSLPHGWGHAAAARWQRTAGAHPGVSANDWTDDAQVEAVVGQSILNGVPVRLRPARGEPEPASA